MLYVAIWYVLIRPVVMRVKEGSYSHTTATRVVLAYTKCDVQLKKVAPDDGLI